MAGPVHEITTLPTRDGYSWEDFNTTEIRDDRYPAPCDWTVTTATTQAVLWEREADSEDNEETSPSRDRAVLVMRRPDEPGSGLGDWCSFGINQDPIVCIEHDDEEAIWNAVSALLIRFSRGQPLFEPEALEEDRPPFTHAADITEGDFRGGFDD